MTYATTRDSVRLAPVSAVAWQQAELVQPAATPAVSHYSAPITPSAALEPLLLVATLTGLSLVLGDVIAGAF